MTENKRYFSDEELDEIYYNIVESKFLKIKPKGFSLEKPGTTRKLKTTWTKEMAKDLESYYRLDIESELINEMKKLV